LVTKLHEHQLKLVTAESCTAGLLSTYIADLKGSSTVYEGGFITYTNAAKTKMLGIDGALLYKYGAVSGQVAKAMSYGAILNSTGNISIAITGVAGPESIENKPVGLIYLALCYKNEFTLVKNQLHGDPATIKSEAVTRAVELVTNSIS
jgi:PncC family amidohydrolase